MSDYKLIETSNTQLANQMTKFEDLLTSMGLPSDNIIASISERENIMNLLPNLINLMPAEQKRNATYLTQLCVEWSYSKFTF